MCFADSSVLPEANVAARRALVARVAREKPNAVLLNGDLPMRGDNQTDYGIYRTETRAWRDAHLRIFSVLGESLEDITISRYQSALTISHVRQIAETIVL
jgi:hypothetical protein